ncbi:enoyl-CoA hydratase family protein [Limibaculum sp. FT325]|uniref:oxepin-CoA hydrolase, alternative type n=1 Tax=Thermohalobaculum sediminis TaxID=2939436 RepID=UPI0020C08F2F|nr:enoyl-CoA hydratase family protein [Limibaculum sediminis]MCL5775946.1 enoyl-CoA hydratase family protein [Limibaculum sediminis]
MTDGRIGLARKGAVLTVTNNDPATRNALGWEFYDGFREIVEEAADDPRTRAIVLTGAGGFFCSGGNVAVLAERAKASHAVRRASVEKLHGMIRAMRACPKPIVAAIEGGAAGAGVSMALACDLIVAARDAYLSVAYVRIGLTPDGGATAMLARALPRALVAEMVMTGDRVSVERLHPLGLVNRLTNPGAALAEAEALAARLADGPPEALAAGKSLISEAAEAPFDTQLNSEAAAIAEALGGAEAAEGIAAFLEKRKPRW